MSKAKPFVKWVGGKGQLLQQLENLLPPDFYTKTNITYVEPFVGGGAMLFYMLQQHRNIECAVINDINPYLTDCYNAIKDEPKLLIEALYDLQEKYYSLADEISRKEFFLNAREHFNSRKADKIENSALFIFLNRTCFNGLYRVNKSGKFNVPFGKYVNPKICDADTILADSALLQKVEIMTGDFEQTIRRADNNSFFYLDPPYRPLNETSSFTSYSKEDFNDDSQRRLKSFCDKINSKGANFLMSNSDGMVAGNNDRFFYDLYESYNINKVWASRNVNSIGSKRGKLTEIAVENYNSKSIAV